MWTSSYRVFLGLSPPSQGEDDHYDQLLGLDGQDVASPDAQDVASPEAQDVGSPDAQDGGSPEAMDEGSPDAPDEGLHYPMAQAIGRRTK